MPIALDKYLRNLPKLHSWDGGCNLEYGRVLKESILNPFREFYDRE